MPQSWTNKIGHNAQLVCYCTVCRKDTVLGTYKVWKAEVDARIVTVFVGKDATEDEIREIYAEANRLGVNPLPVVLRGNPFSAEFVDYHTVCCRDTAGDHPDGPCGCSASPTSVKSLSRQRSEEVKDRPYVRRSRSMLP